MSIEVKQNQLNIDLSSEIQKVLQKTGEIGTKEIKARSPKRSGTYASGWTSVLDTEETVTIHNASKGKSITHLLENGHRSKAGRWVAPQEHIRPGYNVTKRQYLEMLKQIKITPK